MKLRQIIFLWGKPLQLAKNLMTQICNTSARKISLAS